MMVRSFPFVADPSSRMTGDRGDAMGSRASRVWGSRKAVRGSGHGRRQMRNGGVRGGDGRTGRRKEDGGRGRRRWGSKKNRSKKNHTRDGARPDSPPRVWNIYIKQSVLQKNPPKRVELQSGPKTGQHQKLPGATEDDLAGGKQYELLPDGRPC
jgi:hypothetical protein